MTPQEIKTLRKQLLQWFKANKRPLPFRESKNPYNIWLSEIMAQQTTMTAVIDYYKRFIKKFPTLKSVTKADEQSLLQQWQGLGYYSRVRNFQKGCQQVLSDFNGQVPQTKEELLTLKGIGDYTASAIASICFNQPNAVVDGNVKRVIARLNYYKQDISTSQANKYFQEQAGMLLDQKHPGDFNEAIMELGALVCSPKSPKCPTCPIKEHCLAKQHDPQSVPIKKKQTFIQKQYMTLILHSKTKVILKQPSKNNLIKNMWELPSLYDQDEKNPLKIWEQLFHKDLSKKTVENIGSVKHSITNKKITMQIYSLELPSATLTKWCSDGFIVLDKKTLGDIPINTLSRKILKQYYKCDLR